MKMTHISSRLLSVFALFVSVAPLHAQWIKTSGPDSVLTLSSGSMVYGGDVLVPSMIFAGKKGGAWVGVWFSWDMGSNWAINTRSADTNNLTLSTAIGPGYSAYGFAGTMGRGILRTRDIGTDGIYYSNTGLNNLNVYALSILDSNVFAGTDSGVFLSTNNGSTWNAKSNGLTNLHVRALTVNGMNVFAGTEGGVFLSTNKGTNWTLANTGLTNGYVRAFAFIGTNVFAGTDGGVFLSTNNGTNWMAVNTGLRSLHIRSFGVSGTNIFATGDSGVYRSTNNGSSWTAVNTGMTNLSVHALVVAGSYLFAGTDGGLWRRPLSEMVTSIVDRSVAAPANFRLLPSGLSSFTLPAPARVTLIAFKLTGEKTAVLLDERMSAGFHERRVEASAMPRGLHLYRLQAGGVTVMRKMMVAR